MSVGILLTGMACTFILGCIAFVTCMWMYPNVISYSLAFLMIYFGQFSYNVLAYLPFNLVSYYSDSILFWPFCVGFGAVLYFWIAALIYTVVMFIKTRVKIE